jgi:hypothetical protein
MPRGGGGNIERGGGSRTVRAFDRGVGMYDPSMAALYRSELMCRNIKTAFNFEPPATEAEIRASALQLVRNREVEAEKAKERAKARFD